MQEKGQGLVEPDLYKFKSDSFKLLQGRSQGGSWGAREPFCEPFLTKEPTTGGENAMSISWP